jgi:hypothetical protein
MKGSTIWLTAILVILACSLAVGVALTLRHQQSPVPKNGREQRPTIDGSPKEDLTFKEKANFDGETDDNSRFSDLVYEASDGERLTRRIIFYGTPERAGKKMESELKLALQVVERGTKIDAEGRLVGERAVILYAPDRLNKERLRAKVLWTTGDQFNSIDGPSVRHIVDLEKHEAQ